MTITRGELKGQILRILQKDGGYQGFYTDEKLNDAIQDCLDHINVEMFRAGYGWSQKIKYLNSQTGFPTVDLPPYINVIQEVRYLVGNRYLPLIYDDATLAAQFQPAAGLTQFPSRYRIVDQKIYFNPAPAQGGENYVQVEYHTYSQGLVGDVQNLPAEFDRAMTNYCKWRSASLLASSVGKGYKEWKEHELEWRQNAVDIINKRTKSPMFYREFSGA